MNKVSVLNQSVNTPTNLSALPGLASFLQDLTQGSLSFYIKEAGRAGLPAIEGLRKNRDCPKSIYFVVNGTVPFFLQKRQAYHGSRLQDAAIELGIGILSQPLDSQHVRKNRDCPKSSYLLVNGTVPFFLYIKEGLGGIDYRESGIGEESKTISCTPDLREISNKILRFCPLSLS